MALIKCPECGKKISDKATACIHCGCPIERGIIENDSSQIIVKENVELTDESTPTINCTPKENSNTTGAINEKKFYQSTWFIFLMLFVFFPLGIFLLWKYKKTNIAVRIICSVAFAINFLFWLLIGIALLIPCEHNWIDATCTNPMYCDICGETEGNAPGHVEGEWTATKEATLIDVGVEEIFCTVCGKSLDSRGTELKKVKIIGNTFNFTDEELIDWANSWLNGTHEIESYGHFDLGSDILGYRIETDDGENGMLLLKHDGGDEVSAIMVYFDNFVDRSALALFFGTKINSNFVYDDAALVLANNSTYFAANMIATNLTISDGLEVAMLTPESYMYKIISGTPLTMSDGYVFIERDDGEYSEYDNNIWEFIMDTYGDDYCWWFWHDDKGDDTDGGIGEVKTYRGIVLAESTKSDIIEAYGRSDMEITFNKNNDILYRSMKEGGSSDYKYLEDTKSILVYDYEGQFQLVFYIDNAGVVDFILYTSGVWYD